MIAANAGRNTTDVIVGRNDVHDVGYLSQELGCCRWRGAEGHFLLRDWDGCGGFY